MKAVQKRVGSVKPSSSPGLSEAAISRVGAVLDCFRMFWYRDT